MAEKGPKLTGGTGPQPEKLSAPRACCSPGVSPGPRSDSASVAGSRLPPPSSSLPVCLLRARQPLGPFFSQTFWDLRTPAQASASQTDVVRGRLQGCPTPAPFSPAWPSPLAYLGYFPWHIQVFQIYPEHLFSDFNM